MSFYSKYTGEEVEQRLDAVSEIVGQVGEISGALSEVSGKVAEVSEQLALTSASVDAVSGRVNANTTNIAEVAEKVGSIEKDVDVIDESVGALGERVQELSRLTTSVENLSANVTAIGRGVEQLAERVEGVASELDNKQGVLESGVNIKTINGESILGAGDIKVQGGGIGGEVEDVTEIVGNEFVLLMDGDKVLRVPMSVLKAWLGVPSEPEQPDVDENGYIIFKDEEVKRVLMANGVSSDGVGITLVDAEKVTDIGTWFKENTTIESFDEFKFFKNVVSLNLAFSRCLLLQSIELPPNLSTLSAGNINNGASFCDCVSLKEIEGASSIKEIGDASFYRANAVKSINMSNVVVIGASAFEDAYLGDVVAPKLMKFGNFAFSRSAVKNVYDLGKIRTIGRNGSSGWGAFHHCYNLRVVIFPETIKKLPTWAFTDCIGMELMVFKAITPPIIPDVYEFDCANYPIYVPDVSVIAYKTATNWNAVADRIKGVSELVINTPALYEEVKEYIADIDKKLLIIAQSKDIVTDTLQLEASYMGENITPMWSVNSNIASINKNGLLVFSEEGTVNVEAKYDGHTDNIEIKYAAIDVELPTGGGWQSIVISHNSALRSKLVNWGANGGYYGTLHELDVDGNEIAAYKESGDSRTITTTSETVKLVVDVQVNYLQYLYVIDYTSGIYLYEGANI